MFTVPSISREDSIEKFHWRFIQNLDRQLDSLLQLKGLRIYPIWRRHVHTLERFGGTFTAKGRLELRISQNRKWADKNTLLNNSFGWKSRETTHFFVEEKNS